MFCLPARAKYPFFRLELMDYIGGWRNFVQSLSAFLLLFWWQKIAFNRPFELYFPSVYYWILLICVATIRNRGKDTHYVVVSRYAKLYQRFWMKYKSESKHGFTNPEAVTGGVLKKRCSTKFTRKHLYQSLFF